VGIVGALARLGTAVVPDRRAVSQCGRGWRRGRAGSARRCRARGTRLRGRRRHAPSPLLLGRWRLPLGRGSQPVTCGEGFRGKPDVLAGQPARRCCDSSGDHEPRQGEHHPKSRTSLHALQASRSRVKSH
jgi:hypothetical protein